MVYKKTIKIYLNFYVSILHRCRKARNSSGDNLQPPAAYMHWIIKEQKTWAVDFCTCVISKIDNAAFKTCSSITLDTTLSVCETTCFAQSVMKKSREETGGETEGGNKLNKILCMIYRAGGLHFIYLYCSTAQRKPTLTLHPCQISLLVHVSYATILYYMEIHKWLKLIGI